MPYGYTKEPVIYQPFSVKANIVPWLAFIFVLLIGCLAIQLKFNELDFLRIVRQSWSVIAAILVIPLHELAHGGACYLLTRPHCLPKFGRKRWMFFFVYFYAYLSSGAFFSKRRSIVALLTPLLLAILPMLICIFLSPYEWVSSLFIFFSFSTAACQNDIDQAIMLRSEEDGVLIGFRHGYNAKYPP
jgi:hypothetical protein